MSDSRSELIVAAAQEFGLAPLDEEEVDAVLTLAGAAAHGTGDRTAAPLTCFLAGLAASAGDRGAVLRQMRAVVVARTATAAEPAS